MARLTKQSWAKPSLRTKEIEVEELGGSVMIRELPAEYSAAVAGRMEMHQVGKEQIAKVDVAGMERLQFAYGVVDEDEAPMFSEDEVTELQKKHGRAFKTVIAAIDDLSGVDKEAIEAAERRFPSRGEDANGKPDSDAATGGSG